MATGALMSPPAPPSGGDRLQFVCQYCYSPVTIGKPPFIDNNSAAKQPPVHLASSPSTKAFKAKKLSKSNQDSQRAVNLVKNGFEEVVYKSPEESFNSFQKVLLELEQENHGKVNPRLRVTSVNPLVLTAIQSYSELDDSVTSSSGGADNCEHDSSLNTTDHREQSDRQDNFSAEKEFSAAQSEEERSLACSEHWERDRGMVSGSERQRAADNENLLPYSKETADAVFDSLSECSAVDFPLCCFCADVMVERLSSKERDLQDECMALYDLKNTEEAKLKEICAESELDELIAQLESEEAQLLTDLEDLEREKKHLEGVSKKLDEEEAAMLRDECRLSIENNRLQSDIHDLETALKSYSEQLKFSEDHFNALKKTNIFNLVFNIWHFDHKFGTINGFRLGRLNDSSSGTRVEWSEINMALGQACLLLHCLVDKLNFQPNVYTLVPCGSRSYIEAEVPSGSGVNREKLHLYSEGGNKFFYDSSIDNAMKAFLNVLDQFRTTLEHKNSEFRLPYPMRGEFIYEKQGSDIGFSVCPGRTSSEVWTKACRMLLTNLKWGIVGVSTVAPHPSDWLQPQNPPGSEGGSFMPHDHSSRLSSTVSGGVARKGGGGGYHYPGGTNS